MDGTIMLRRLSVPLILLSTPAAYAEPIFKLDDNFVLTRAATVTEPRQADRFDNPGVDPIASSDVTDQHPVTAVSRERAHLLIAAGPKKLYVLNKDWENSALNLRLQRTKSIRHPYEQPTLSYNRFALWSTDVALDQHFGTRDTVTQALSYDLQRRRPAYYLGIRNNYRTDIRAAALQWTHDQRWRIAVGLFDTQANAARSGIERSVELAGGAPLAARGTSLSASFSPSGNPDAFSVGFDLRQQRHSARDTSLLGNPSGRGDTRATFSIRRSF